MTSRSVLRRPLPMALAPIAEKEVVRQLRPMFVMPLADPDDERFAMIQQTLSLHPETGSWQLACRHQALMQVTAYHDLPLLHLGFGTFPNAPRTFRGANTDWVVMDAADDPATKAYGELVVPTMISDRIDRIAAAGIDFDGLVIAHEVPKNQIGDDGYAPFEVLAPPYAAESQNQVLQVEGAAERLWASVRSGVDTTAKAIQAAAIPTAKVALAGAAVTAAAAALAVGAVAVVAVASIPFLMTVDPILFGVLRDKRAQAGQPASSALYYIGHWCWSEVE